MLALWVVLIIACGLALLCGSREQVAPVSAESTPALSREDARVRNGLVALLIVYLSIFAGLRTNFNDTYAYIMAYINMLPFPEIFSDFSWRLGANPGFILTNSIMSAMGFSYNTFVLFYSALYMASCILFMRRYSCNFAMSVFLFICAHGFLFSFGAMKQCTAIAIGLFAIPYLLSNKWPQALIILALAATFHPYILLFVVIPFFHSPPWTKQTWLMIGGTLVIAMTFSFFLGAIVSVTDMIGEDYDMQQFAGQGMNILRVLVAITPIPLSLVFRKNIVTPETTRTDYIFISCCFIYGCIMFIGLFGTANLFGRLAYYFIIFTTIALPLMLKKLADNTRTLITAATVFFYLIFFYYSNAISMPFDENFYRITLWKYLFQG